MGAVMKSLTFHHEHKHWNNAAECRWIYMYMGHYKNSANGYKNVQNDSLTEQCVLSKWLTIGYGEFSKTG